MLERLKLTIAVGINANSVIAVSGVRVAIASKTLQTKVKPQPSA